MPKGKKIKGFNFEDYVIDDKNIDETEDWAIHLLNHEDSRVKGEAAYLLCKNIINKCSNKENIENKWNIIQKLANNSDYEIQDKVLMALGDYYHELPEELVWDLILDISSSKSRKIKESCLYVAIQRSKELSKKRKYMEANSTLKPFLDDFRYKLLNLFPYYSFNKINYTIGINSIRYLSSALLLFFFMTSIFYITLYFSLIPIYSILVHSNIISQAYTPNGKFSPFIIALFTVIFMIITTKYLIKYDLSLYAPKAYEYQNKNTIIMILSIFTIFTIISVYTKSLVPLLLNSPFLYDFGTRIAPFLFFCILLSYLDSCFNSKNFNLVLLSNGLYNYFKGRYYIQKYIKSRKSSNKLRFLKKSIKRFQNATKSYNNLIYELGNDLSICPYCLNFYQSIEIYENIIRRPEKPKIQKFEKNINNARFIINETGKGSNRLNEVLNELLTAVKILTELYEKRKTFGGADPVDKLNIDREIKKKSKEIDSVVSKMEIIISDIEDQNLPLMIKIIKSKKLDLDKLSEDMGNMGIKGIDKYYSEEQYDLIGILIFIVGIIILILGGFYSYNYLIIGIILSVVSSIMLYFAKIKKKI